MTYNKGTATDYTDMLDQLIEVCTSRHMATVAVNAGGANHVVGEILSISATGATSTHVAEIEVLEVSAGAVTVARIYRGGAYTVDPTTIIANASTSTGFTYDGTATTPGTGATFDLTFAATGWTQEARSQIVTAEVIADGGTGYSVSDTLTLVGGVIGDGSAATYNVDTVSGGVITGVTLLDAGNYEVGPTGNVPLSGGGNNDAEFTVTLADKAGDTVVRLKGDAGSSLAPLVGIKTYSTVNDESDTDQVFNWAVFGFASEAPASPLHLQPSISPGFSNLGDGSLTTSITGDGSFVPFKDADAFPIEWTLSVTSRRIVLIAQVQTATETRYAHMSVGLLNPLATTSEYTYPMLVAGSSDRLRVWYGDSTPVFGGLSEVISRSNGPAFVWSPEGAWIEQKNAEISGNQSSVINVDSQNSAPRSNVWPLGRSNVNATAEDATWATASSTGFDQGRMRLSVGATRVYPTPDTGGDLSPMFPISYIQSDSSGALYRAFGELDGVFWLDDAGRGISSEDREIQDGSAYTIFSNGTRTDPWSFLALRED